MPRQKRLFPILSGVCLSSGDRIELGLFVGAIETSSEIPST
jgi:hypothetical protein